MSPKSLIPPHFGTKIFIVLSKALAALLLGFCLAAVVAWAQSGSQQQPSEPPPEAGGPSSDVGPMAVPKKKEEPPPERTRPPKKPEGMPDYSLRVDVPLVNVPVLVTTKDGQFIPGLKAENFRVLEDGVPQKITNFTQNQNAPLTAVLLTEFAATNYAFVYDAMNASYTFANTLKPDDWVAVMYFDLKPHILVDFTRDKREVVGALRQLAIPTWRETNLFDALYDAVDRLDQLEGRKYIILISSGVDTFSRINLDAVFKKLKETKNITVFAIGTGQYARAISDPYMGSISRLTYLQADNQMNTFAKMTGGRAYFPRFQGEFREIFGDIAQSIRNQYILAYHPSNAKQDGSFRKIKVELMDIDGKPLKVHDQKGKDVKYQVMAREGYRAKLEVE